MKKLLYIFDDINYLSGVKTATALQVETLRGEYDISLFSITKPDGGSLAMFPGIPVLGSALWDGFAIYSMPCRAVLRGSFSPARKLSRLAYSLAIRLRLEPFFLRRYFSGKTGEMNAFDYVIVLSEASKLREPVQRLKRPKKIQWIHIDYGMWSRYNSWTRGVTYRDFDLYSRFDAVVTLSEHNRLSFISCHPALAEKVHGIRNLFDIRAVREKALEPLDIPVDDVKINIITVCRFDIQKALDRLLRVCRRLKGSGCDFKWYLVGDGPLYGQIRQLSVSLGLDDITVFTGKLDNPLPLLKRCGLFALPSVYEGTPVTVYEAMALGVPVAATAVGGVPEQVRHNVDGVLLDNDEDAIFLGLKDLLLNPGRLGAMREALRDFEYDNESVLNDLRGLFGHR